MRRMTWRAISSMPYLEQPQAAVEKRQPRQRVVQRALHVRGHGVQRGGGTELVAHQAVQGGACPHPQRRLVPRQQLAQRQDLGLWLEWHGNV